MYYILNLRKTHLVKGDELSTECRHWWEWSGDESEAIKIRRPRRQVRSPRWEPCLIRFNTNKRHFLNNGGKKEF